MDFFSELGDNLTKGITGYFNDLTNPGQFFANNIVGGSAIASNLGMNQPTQPIAPQPMQTLNAATGPTYYNPPAPQPVVPPDNATTRRAAQDIMGEPVSFDQMGRPISFNQQPVNPFNYYDEQEIKRQEQELAAQRQQQAQQTPVPAQPTAPTPVVGAGAPIQTATIQSKGPNEAFTPVNPAEAVIASNTTPATPQPQPYVAGESVNRIIARNESGNNEAIGYHYPEDENGNRTSTAFGKFGITAPAYEDIKKYDPYFANKTIDTLSIADQGRAANVYANNVLAPVLRQNGIDVNDNTISAAWFAGAQGLVDYMKNGTISDAMANANGGRDKVAAIINDRLKGSYAPSSMAGHSYEAKIQEASTQGVDDLLKISNDTTIPTNYRRQAADLAQNKITKQRQEAQIKQDVDNGLAKGDISDLAKYQNSNAGNFGDLAAGLLYNALGMKEMANAHMQRWDPQLTASVQSFGGKNYTVYKDPFGNIRQAYGADGMSVTPQVKSQLQANPAMPSIKNSIMVPQADGTEKLILETTDGKIINQDGTDYKGSLSGAHSIGTQDPFKSKLMDQFSKTLQGYVDQGVSPAIASQWAIDEVNATASSFKRPDMMINKEDVNNQIGSMKDTEKHPTDWYYENPGQYRPAGWDGNPNTPGDTKQELKTRQSQKRLEEPEIQTLAQGLVDGTIDPAKITGYGSNNRAIILARAKKIDPAYDEKLYPARQASLKTWLGGSTNANMVRSLSVSQDLSLIHI